MKVVPSGRRDLHAANFTSTAPEFSICKRESIAFNSLLSSARITAQAELNSLKIAPVNSVEDSVLLEACQLAGSTQGLLNQHFLGLAFVAPFSGNSSAHANVRTMTYHKIENVISTFVFST